MVLVRYCIVILIFFCLGNAEFYAIADDAYDSTWSMYDFHYEVNLTIEEEQHIIDGIYSIFSGSEIENEIKSLRTFSEAKKTVNNMKTLHERINNDIAVIYKKVHALGFYGANVTYNIKKSRSNKNVSVQIKVILGKLFKLRLSIKYLNTNDKFSRKYKQLLTQNLQNYSSAIKDIRQLIKDVVYNLQSIGYYKPHISEKRVYLDYKHNEAVLYLTIDPKKQMKFSSVTINAFPGINTQYIKNRIAWQEDEIYDIEKIDNTIEQLKSSQIFSQVMVKPMDGNIKDDRIPMLIKLEEDKKHTIDFGILYSSARNNIYHKSDTKKLKSIITKVSLTRYNAFGNGEELSGSIEGTLAGIKHKRSDYAFEIILTQPDLFLRNNQTQYLYSRRQELTNMFFKRNDRVSLMLDYPLWFFTSIRAGIMFEKNYVDGAEVFNKLLCSNRHYKDIIIPVELTLNKTDNLLNPTKGYKASLKFNNIKFKNATIKYLQYLEINFSYNYPIDKYRKNIFAFNLSRKILFGGDIDSIPLDKRIYAGGINSVRGYAKQLASERINAVDIQQSTSEKINDISAHMGGKSSIEFNTEIRRKFTKDFGVVVFFDGAKILHNKSRFPELMTESKRWFLSYGAGIRYFSVIGPLRVDFAFPIKRRKNVDSKVQFIISLGQAF